MYLPNKKEFNLALNSFTQRERVFFFAFLVIFVISFLTILWRINNKYLTEVPTVGGTLSEGIVSEAPRFINPLLAISDADKDLTQLIYSGLLRTTKDGKYIEDLAESYKISADGLTYTLKIKDSAVWHDGKPVTSDDILFTILAAKDPTIKSPKRAGFEGVAVEKVDQQTVAFKLKQPYSPFLENMTLGILPKHIWKDMSAESFAYNKYNLEPIGSGPYKMEKIKIRKSGDTTSGSINSPEYYDLKPFKRFVLGQAKVEKLRIKFYPTEDALLSAYLSKDVDSINTIPPERAKELENKSVKITREVLPRIFAIFLNQNHSKVLADKSVRRALSIAVNKNEIIEVALLNYGARIDGPIPSLFTNTSQEDYQKNLEAGKDILKRGGWKFNEKKSVWEKNINKSLIKLSLDLATADTEELKKSAEIIKKNWEALGVQVNLKIFEIGDLNQNVIRTRKYDSLFFGEIIGRNPDLFSFWHSSQRNDPGLNIAMYTNSKADKLLETARIEQNIDKKNEKYRIFKSELDNDLPAIFIYSPYFLYITPEKVKNVNINNVSIPSDRFIDIHNWYIDTDKVWKIFVK